MKIIETDFKWSGGLTTRSSTKYIILHHRAGNGSVQSIHNQHLNQGWAGIGYNFYVRKDGSVYRGRPIDKAGAHTAGFNSSSVGVCFEGNYQSTDTAMPDAQFKAGQELITYLKNLYPSATVVKHSKFGGTVCPGQHFPFDEMINPTPTSTLLVNADEITWELNYKYFPITQYEKFIEELDQAKKNGSSLYWGYYKLVNGVK